MTRTTLLSAALLFAPLATPALAQAVASTNPAEVQSGTYSVDPLHTQVGFSLLHMGFSHFDGHFAEASGSLTLSVSDPAASKLSVSLPTASVSTPVAKLNEELVAPEWFDAAKFPTISFVSTKVTPLGKDSAKVAGNLTLHGVTKPVVLTAHFVGAGVNPIDKKYTVGFDATGKIKRSDFCVSTYLPLIGDEVTLSINGAFERHD